MQCETRCDEMTAFNCRSYAFSASNSLCRLSGDDTLSAGPNSIGASQGTNYYQTAPCVDREYRYNLRQSFRFYSGPFPQILIIHAPTYFTN